MDSFSSILKLIIWIWQHSWQNWNLLSGYKHSLSRRPMVPNTIFYTVKNENKKIKSSDVSLWFTHIKAAKIIGFVYFPGK